MKRNVPANLRDPGGHWFGLTVRARTIMRSTERVSPDAATTYEDLGDPRWKDKLCLRSGTSKNYNVSFVADRLAKDGEAKTEAMLRRWMANDPDDPRIRHRRAGCDCRRATATWDSPTPTTSAAKLADDPDFPVAPVWADQNGRGTHLNLSGPRRGGRAPISAARRIRLMRVPSRAGSSRSLFAHNNFEFAADPGVEAAEEIAQFGTFKRDPIDVKAPASGWRTVAADGAGRLELIHRPAADGLGGRPTVGLAPLIGGPLLGAAAELLREPGSLSVFVSLMPEALVATARWWSGWGWARCCWAPRSPPWSPSATSRPLVDRVGAGAPAGGAGLRLHPLRAGTGRARGCAPRAARSSYSRWSSIRTSTCWRAARSSPVAHALRGGARARPGAVRPSCGWALPLARPAILGGVVLAVMEALADFGTVNLLGVHTFTDAIYRVWFNAFNRPAAMQFGGLLTSVTLTLLLLERVARGRARNHYAPRGERWCRRPAHGPAAAAAVSCRSRWWALVVAWPLAQLGVWSVQSVQEGLLAAGVRGRHAHQHPALRDERGDRARPWRWRWGTGSHGAVRDGGRIGPAGYDRLRPHRVRWWRWR